MQTRRSSPMPEVSQGYGAAPFGGILPPAVDAAALPRDLGICCEPLPSAEPRSLLGSVVRFDLIGEMGEVAFLAKTDESFREALQLIPHDTDVFRLFRVDAAV
jgi:hypothetical protein